MKAKLIEEYKGLTKGKIYEIKPYIDENGDIDNELFTLVDDRGVETGVFKYRFEVLPADLIQQIKEEEEHLADLKKQLEKELEEQNTPKVGNRYKHRGGCEYVLAEIINEFALICYKGKYIGISYGNSSKFINSIFQGNEEFFSLIKEA